MFEELDPTEEEINQALVNELVQRIWPTYRGRTIDRLTLHSELIQDHFAEFKHTHLTRTISALQVNGFIAAMSSTPGDGDNVITFKP